MPTLAQSITKILPGSAVSYPGDRTNSVDRYFTGAIGADTLLTQAKKELAKLGFEKKNSIRMPRLPEGSDPKPTVVLSMTLIIVRDWCPCL